MSIDWGVGRYERTAEQLLPAAQVVVDTAQVRAGERVLDVGCGTGNAALLAAERGARVVGVDPAARLLEVARERARDVTVDVDFVRGEAADMPVDPGSFDVVLSVFAVIFAPEPEAAFAGMARALAPGGRIVVSAWVPGGAIGRMSRIAAEAVADALGLPPGPAPFAWHEPDAVIPVGARHDLRVSTTEHTLVFTAPSAEAMVDDDSENHPMAISGRRIVEQSGGDPAELRNRLVAVLKEGNEDPSAFRATSRYVVHTFTRT